MEQRPATKRARSASAEQGEHGRSTYPPERCVTHSVLLIIGYCIPHCVVPQLLRPVLAAHIDSSVFVFETPAERVRFATVLSLRGMCTEAQCDALWALEFPILDKIFLDNVEGIDLVVTKLADHAPQHFPRLRELSVEHCFISETVQAALCRMPTITCLHFFVKEDCITESVRAVLYKEMPQLQRIWYVCRFFTGTLSACY